MKNRISFPIVLLFILLGSGAALKAQNAGSAVDYLDRLGAESERIQAESWAYTSQIAHGSSARKEEKRRQALLTTIGDARGKVMKMPGYEGKTEFRDTVSSFLRVYYFVISEDYSRILDLEEVADQSPDLMEAFILAQQMANNKLQGALKRVQAAQTKFAAENNVNLIEEESAGVSKQEKSNEVFAHYNVHNLIVLRGSFQEGRMFDAMEQKDINQMEQTINTLLDVVAAGKDSLVRVSNYDGDRSLAAATEALLAFYLQEATVDFPASVDFFLAEEKVKSETAKIKKVKSPSQEQIDQYQKLVNDYNAGLPAYNARNEKANREREKLLEAWNRAGRRFLDTHVPK